MNEFERQYLQKYGGLSDSPQQQSQPNSDQNITDVDRYLEKYGNVGRNEGVLGDIVDLTQSGAASGVGSVLDFVGADDAAQYMYDVSERVKTTLTPEMVSAMEQPLFVDADNSVGFKANPDATWRTYVGTGAELTGQIAPNLVAGGGVNLAVRGLSAAGKTAKALRAGDIMKNSRSTTRAKLAENYEKLAAEQASSVTGKAMGALAGAQAGGLGGQQAYDQVMNTGIDKLAESENYKRLVRLVSKEMPDATPSQILKAAKEELAVIAERDRAYDPVAYGINYAAGVVGDKFVLDAVTGSVKSSVSKAAGQGVLASGGTGAIAEASDTYASNRTTQELVDPNQRLSEGVAASAATGFVFEGALGGASGAYSGAVNSIDLTRNQQQTRPDETPPVTPEDTNKNPVIPPQNVRQEPVQNEPETLSEPEPLPQPEPEIEQLPEPQPEPQPEPLSEQPNVDDETVTTSPTEDLPTPNQNEVSVGNKEKDSRNKETIEYDRYFAERLSNDDFDGDVEIDIDKKGMATAYTIEQDGSRGEPMYFRVNNKEKTIETATGSYPFNKDNFEEVREKAIRERESVVKRTMDKGKHTGYSQERWRGANNPQRPTNKLGISNDLYPLLVSDLQAKARGKNKKEAKVAKEKQRFIDSSIDEIISSFNNIGAMRKFATDNNITGSKRSKSDLARSIQNWVGESVNDLDQIQDKKAVDKIAKDIERNERRVPLSLVKNVSQSNNTVYNRGDIQLAKEKELSYIPSREEQKGSDFDELNNNINELEAVVKGDRRLGFNGWYSDKKSIEALRKLSNNLKGLKGNKLIQSISPVVDEILGVKRKNDVKNVLKSERYAPLVRDALEKHIELNDARNKPEQSTAKEIPKPETPDKNKSPKRKPLSTAIESDAAPREISDAKRFKGIKLEDFVRDKVSALDLTKWLIANPTNPAYRRIAERILPLIPDGIDVQVISNNKPLRRPVPSIMEAAKGVFSYRMDGSNLRIILKDTTFKDHGLNKETILHELIHSATALSYRRAIDNPLAVSKELLSAVRQFNVLRDEIIEALNTGDGLLIKKQLHPKMIDLVLRDPEELMAWGLTSDYMQNLLKLLKLKEKQSAWSKFVQAIARIAGIKKADHTALGRVIQASDDLLTAIEGQELVTAKAMFDGANDKDIIKAQAGLEVPFDFPTRTEAEAGQSMRDKTFVKGKKRKIDEVLNEVIKRFRQGFADSNRAWHTIDRILGIDPEMNANESRWARMRLAKSADSAFHVFMNYNPLKWSRDKATLDVDENTDKDNQGFSSVLKKIGSYEEVQDFFRWMAANRANDLKKNPNYKELLFEADEIAAGMRFNTGRTADGRSRAAVYAQAKKDFDRYHGANLDIAMEAGVISKQQREAWRDQFYVPFHRAFDDATNDQIIGAAGAGFAKRDVIKKIKGSKRGLGDLIENYFMNTQALLDASLKNKAARHAMSGAIELHIAKRVTNPKLQKGDDVTFVMNRGKKQYYKFDLNAGSGLGRLAFESLNAMSPIAIPTWAQPVTNVLSGTKRFVTDKITKTPWFPIANTIRDSIQSALLEDGGGQLIRGMRAYRVGSGMNHTKARMLATGAAFSFGHNFADHAAGIEVSIQGRMRKLEVLNPKNSKKLLGTLWDRWGDVTDSFENVNRAAIFTKSLEKGESVTQAAFKARDIMDFSAHGAWQWVRFMSSMVGFFNARIQGAERSIRGVERVWGKRLSESWHRRRMFLGLGLITSFTALNYFNNHDDDDYHKMPDWIRDNYWYVKDPFGSDVRFFIPKPFEWGLPSTILEHAFDVVTDGADKKTLKGASDFIWRTGMNTFSMNPTPTAIRPLIELYMNYDMFRQQDIDGYYEKLGVNQSDRSRLARGVSALSKYNPYGDGISAKKIEHLLRGYLGGQSELILGFTELLTNPFDPVKKPTKDWLTENPFTRRFYKDASKPMSTKYSSLFYNLMDESAKSLAMYRHLKSIGHNEAAKVYKDENLTALKAGKKGQKIQKYLQHLNRYRRRVYNDMSLSADEKRDELNKIDHMKNQLTEKGYRLFQDNK